VRQNEHLENNQQQKDFASLQAQLLSGCIRNRESKVSISTWSISQLTSLHAVEMGFCSLCSAVLDI
jgi:hypothetical protein